MGELTKNAEKERTLYSDLKKQANLVQNLKQLVAEKDEELMQWRQKYNALSTSMSSAISKSRPSSPAVTRCASALGNLNRSNTTVGVPRLISLDSPVAFSGKASNSSFGSTSTSVTPTPFQPTTTNLKPTILASYSVSSKSSHNSTNSETSSLSSAAKSVLMSGRITKGSVLPRSASRHF